MRYLGGKSKIATQIANYIVGGGGTLVSLFCGTCSVESRVKGFDRVICNDIHPYLIAMLQGVQNGYDLPEVVTEEEYQRVRHDKDKDKCLTGFIGFACAFGGKFFGGYARNNSNRNYAREGKKSLLKDMAHLQHAEFTCKDYREVEIPQGAVIYADPPYANTTGYNNQTFDTKAFWEYMRKLARNGHKVFISEQIAPDDFQCVWERDFTRTLDRNKNNQFKVTERLFTYNA